jgi:mannose-6-phosphate isomerase class I
LQILFYYGNFDSSTIFSIKNNISEKNVDYFYTAVYSNDMSFMFNPFPYDDPEAVNRITADTTITADITAGLFSCAKRLAVEAENAAKNKGYVLIGVDGYISAPLREIAGAIASQCACAGLKAFLLEADIFKNEEILEKELLEYLPLDRETDPVLLYGKVYHGAYEGLSDPAKLEAIEKKFKAFIQKGDGILLVYGNGVLMERLRSLFDIKIFLDITPKRAVLNLKSGKYGNLGSSKRDTANLTLRRAYYVDFEAAGTLRGKVLREHLINYYIAADNLETMKMTTIETLHKLFSLMLTYPLRCRPVYLEGVWGGFYIKHLRHLPGAMKNCAWVFDLIPLEVSIVADMGELEMEFPFFTFVQVTAERLLGEKSVKKFGPYFPIRFNYDDTFHSSGNMSIQVHPGEEYVRQNNNEFGRQDESYYIVATAQDAKTYLGFQEKADVEEFITKTRQAERTGHGFNHDSYIYSKPSRPGDQFLIPAGTIHASGRNQLILEIGSLTIGSYTYKMYDYLRKDLEGRLRPIHTHHGDKVLKRDRREKWVTENLIQNRKLLRQEEGFAEYIVGEHDLLYFSLRNAVFAKRYEDETSDRFHVLVLVDGEKVLIRSKTDPSRFFKQNYLEMVIIPAGFGPYEVINEGVGLITLHKTLLKEGVENA